MSTLLCGFTLLTLSLTFYSTFSKFDILSPSLRSQLIVQDYAQTTGWVSTRLAGRVRNELVKNPFKLW